MSESPPIGPILPPLHHAAGPGIGTNIGSNQASSSNIKVLLSNYLTMAPRVKRNPYTLSETGSSGDDSASELVYRHNRYTKKESKKSSKKSCCLTRYICGFLKGMFWSLIGLSLVLVGMGLLAFVSENPYVRLAERINGKVSVAQGGGQLVSLFRANGEIWRISKKENPDLFSNYAIRETSRVIEEWKWTRDILDKSMNGETDIPDLREVPLESQLLDMLQFGMVKVGLLPTLRDGVAEPFRVRAEAHMSAAKQGLDAAVGEGQGVSWRTFRRWEHTTDASKDENDTAVESEDEHLIPTFNPVEDKDA